MTLVLVTASHTQKGMLWRSVEEVWGLYLAVKDRNVPSGRLEPEG